MVLGFARFPKTKITSVPVPRKDLCPYGCCGLISLCLDRETAREPKREGRRGKTIWGLEWYGSWRSAGFFFVFFGFGVVVLLASMGLNHLQ